MNTTDLQAFNQAVQLANIGQKMQAHQALKSLQRTNPTDANLLMWLAFTAPSPFEAEQYYNNLVIAEPNNQNLPALRDWLAKEKAVIQVGPQPQVMAQPVPQQAKPRPLNPILLGIIGAVVVLVIAVVLVIRFVASQPAPLPPDGDYTSFANDDEMISRASVGQHIRVPATIDYVPAGDTEETFTITGAYGIVQSGIILRIPVDNKRNVAFKQGKNVYFCVVTGRQTIDGKPYIVAEVEQVK